MLMGGVALGAIRFPVVSAAAKSSAPSSTLAIVIVDGWVLSLNDLAAGGTAIVTRPDANA